MKILAGFSPIARALVVSAAIAILLTFLEAAASIVTPILLAAFIAVVATPPLRWMHGKGVPKWFALGIVVFILLDAGSIFALIATGALEGFRDSLPGYQERLILLTEQLGSFLEGVGVENADEAVPDIFNPAAVTGLVHASLANVGAVFATGLLVLLAVGFMLLEAPSLQAKLRAAFGLTEESEARLQRVFGSLTQYMVIKTLTSLGTAFCIWLMLWFFGIDFAALWAILAFLLNFIPFIGAVLMAVPAVLMALVQTDIGTALVVALGYVVVNTGIGSVLEPRIMGRGLGISTLAVFLSLLLWSWVFGTVGAFLSVPLTMVLLVALEASPQTRPIAILLGPDLTSEEATRQESNADEGSPNRDDGATDEGSEPYRGER